MDSAGLEPTAASAHYLSRSGRRRTQYRKVSLSVVCGSLLPLGLVLDWGPNNDKLADAADWVHGVCREVWGVRSVIKPVVHRTDGTLGGCDRPQMTPRVLQASGDGRRWHIESFISGLKRFCGSTLNARRHLCQRHESGVARPRLRPPSVGCLGT